MISNNFYLTVGSYAVSYMFAECWYGPVISMILSLFPAGLSGTSIAIFSLFGSSMGAISSYVLGVLGDKYETAIHPDLAGYFLGGFCTVSYIGCALPFIFAGYMFKKYVRNKE